MENFNQNTRTPVGGLSNTENNNKNNIFNVTIDLSHLTEDERKFDILHNAIVEHVKDRFQAIYDEKYHSQDKLHFESTCALGKKQSMIDG